jgi:hypothetical protein
MQGLQGDKKRAAMSGSQGKTGRKIRPNPKCGDRLSPEALDSFSNKVERLI